MIVTKEELSRVIKPYVNEIRTDALGNVIAHKMGAGKRIMLVAHYDVISLMITYIDERGFLYVQPAGGIDVSILPARKVMIMHGENVILGIIGKKPIHLSRDEQNNKVTYDSLWIDIGAKTQTEAMTMVSKGDYAYFCSDKEELSNGFITGAYLDNKVGLEVLLNIAERLSNITLPWDVYYVASNHEEIGMRGALVAAQSIQPDVCICVDVTHATDYPTMNVIRDGDIKLGEGCVLAKGPNIHPQLLECLVETASIHGIKYQIEVCPYPTGTDANMVQLSGNGVKTAVVSIPCRYMHTPHEVCSQIDIELAIKVIYQFISKTNYAN